ncbi:DNA cytosine methyltransferase [Adlercreutzia equolifaciens]|uniref:DNA cytosine methyltransferase n=1 Tax=Adlercreutzia equolifaciens TaxID=446660 RepID=UPI001EDD5552|nr:DNA cytosine methyltransferase [Adlercreutzia equolifaciens]MCG4825667.1 DNA cytosine methyltransferase [Adlercreutzia equolifaciens]
MRVVSLFSGAGGLDLGFVEAGHEVVWANDNDRDAVETYRRNIGDHIVLGDIREMSTDDIPDCDIVIGGFPCQGFSVANAKRHELDERNQLYKEFLRVVAAKRPKFFLAENVKGILSIGKGEVIKAIVRDFEGIDPGYEVDYRLLNAADYGVPQTRQRVIIVGVRKDVGVVWTYPEPTHSRDGAGGLPKWVSVEEAIGGYPDPDLPNDVPNHVYSKYKVKARNFTGHRVPLPTSPSPTILARGNGGGGVCAIPHYNGSRRMTIRESAKVQTFPDWFIFDGKLNSCYRQIGNAVPVRLAYCIGLQFNLLGR